MKWTGARISVHARNQLIARWPGKPPACFHTALAELLDQAVEEDLGYSKVVRMINNGGAPAKYFTAEGWRFVFDEDLQTLLTCERIYFKAKRPYKKKRRQP